MKWNIFNVLVLLGIVQGIILSSTLFFEKRYKSKTNFYLGLLLLFLSLTNLEYWIIDTRLSKFNLFLEHFFIPFQHLILPTLFIYVSHYTDYKYLIKKNRILLYLPFSLFTVFHMFLMIYHIYIKKGFSGIIRATNFIYLFEEIVSVSLSIYFIWLIFRVLKKYEKSNENFENKTLFLETRWIKNLLLLGIIVSVFWALNTISAEYIGNYHRVASYLLWLGVSFIIYWIGYTGLYQFRLAKDRKAISILLEELSKHKKEDLNGSSSKKNYTKEHPIFKKLEELIEHEHIYREQDLSLYTLAKRLETNTSTLSKVINQTSNKGFIDFINHYRVKEAKEILHNPLFDQYKISAIGYEVGFNNASTFYSTFKRYTGNTPSKYKEQQ